MKKVKILILVGFLVFSVSAKAQELPVSRNAFIFSLAGNFSSMESENVFVLDGTDDKTTSFSVSPNADYFFTRYFYAGLGVKYSYAGFEGYKYQSYGVGPNLGFAYTMEEWPVVLRANFSYWNNKTYQDHKDFDDTSTSNAYYFGGGIIFPLKSHIGITLDGHYVFYNYNSAPNTKGLQFTLGISGLLYSPAGD